MRILGPLVCSTTLPVTDTLLSASASAVTAAPSTTSSAGKLTSAPGSASSFSTATTSPTATLYCFPPVLTIAYIGAGLLLLDDDWGPRTRVRRTNPEDPIAELRSRMTEPTGWRATN